MRSLKTLIETDREGSRHLGEVALIPKKSPISEMGILFYNTLFRRKRRLPLRHRQRLCRSA